MLQSTGHWKGFLLFLSFMLIRMIPQRPMSKKCCCEHGLLYLCKVACRLVLTWQ
jgi:hypothetical protein